MERFAVRKRVGTARVTLAVLGVTALMTLALSADRRNVRLEEEVSLLRQRLVDARMVALESTHRSTEAVSAKADPIAAATATTARQPSLSAEAPSLEPDSPSKPHSPGVIPVPAALPAGPRKRESLMIDPDAVRQSLSATFGEVELRAVMYDQAVDSIQIRIPDPLAVAYLAIVDLTAPGLQIKVGGDLNAKSRSADFVVPNEITVAVNGEAGNSPAANSGLGTWRGHMMADGQVLLSEVAGNPRPFLSFDKLGRAAYTPMSAVDRTIPANAYNVIWGRFDTLIEGQVHQAVERDRQPRTVMGIDREGTKLFLLVVDGRQPQHSMGFTRTETGALLKAFGAYYAMLCDEGGSSSMFLKLWGIVNSPSDGIERATYTHFGVRTLQQ